MTLRLTLFACFIALAIALLAFGGKDDSSPTNLPRAAANARLKDWAQLGYYRNANAALPPAPADRVIFFGDSITEQWSTIGQPFFPGRPYLNRGISGQTTPQMLVRFRQDVLDLHPATVVLLAGINDIGGRTGPSTQQMIEDNLRSMAELARANGVRAVLSTVLPAANSTSHSALERTEKILALNRWITEYCVAQHLTCIDYFTPMSTPTGGARPDLFYDDLHPNAAGYAIMAPLAEAALQTP